MISQITSIGFKSQGNRQDIQRQINNSFEDLDLLQRTLSCINISSSRIIDWSRYFPYLKP